VLGFEPSQEHPSSAKAVISGSRVPTPTPIKFNFGYTAYAKARNLTSL